MTNLEIGRIGKAHGLRGEVTAVITSDRPERTAPGAVWVLDAGPVTVRSIRPFQTKWIATLDGVDTREAAEALTGQVISGEPIDDDDALWAHELVGATVVTPDGTEWGTVTGVYPNPASDLHRAGRRHPDPHRLRHRLLRPPRARGRRSPRRPPRRHRRRRRRHPTTTDAVVCSDRHGSATAAHGAGVGGLDQVGARAGASLRARLAR